MTTADNLTAVTVDKFGYKIDGVRYPRVTTIKAKLSTGSGLVDWAARMVAERVGGYAEAYRRGEITVDGLLAAITDPGLARAHDETRDQAANFGMVVHKMIERLALGDQNALDVLEAAPDMRDVWADAEAFLAWNDRVKPKWGINEAVVYNTELGYAGTLDAIVMIDGRRLILDVKTSKSVYSEYSLQLVAYRRATNILIPATVGGRTGYVSKGMTRVDGAAVLHVRDGRAVLYELPTGEEEWEAFLACHRLYWWSRNAPKTLEALS